MDEGRSVSLLTDDDDASSVSTRTHLYPIIGVPAVQVAAVQVQESGVLAESMVGVKDGGYNKVIIDHDYVEEVDDLRHNEVEIVGLYGSTNGRSCNLHACCGKTLVRGDLLRLIPMVVTINNVQENAVKFVRITEGMQACTVGYLPRVWYNLPTIKKNMYQFVQVSELYSESTNTFKRHKDNSNLGMAGCYFVLDIPIEE